MSYFIGIDMGNNGYSEDICFVRGLFETSEEATQYITDHPDDFPLNAIVQDYEKWHEAKAEELIRDYNAKVYQIMEEVRYNYRTESAEFSAGRDFDGIVQVPDPGVIV